VASRAADALSSGGDVFARDDDPGLVRDAVPFALKAMESLLAERPEHKGLLAALAKGFTQYAVAFVLQDALEAGDPAVRREGVERARRLLLRAKGYGLRGLSVGRPGFESGLAAGPAGAAALAGPGDVPLLYWTAASWSVAVSHSPNDPALLADLPRCEALMRRALSLDEGYDFGAIHESFIAFEGGRPEAMGGSVQKARRHFERAMELSGGERISPLVTYAETVSVRAQDRKEFLGLPQQQRAGVRGELATVETSHYVTVVQGVKIEARFDTHCRQKGCLRVGHNLFSQNKLCHRRQPLVTSIVRYAGQGDALAQARPVLFQPTPLRRSPVASSS
jgi:hypothetical protein